MSTKRLIPVAILAAALVSGCAPGTLYNYGDYSDQLYEFQRDPTERADYVAELREIIADGSEPGAKQPVPPGIRAELGYMMLETGDTAEAEQLFRAEKQAWPESALFMDRMIAVARGEAPMDFTAQPTPERTSTPAPATKQGAGAPALTN